MVFPLCDFGSMLMAKAEGAVLAYQFIVTLEKAEESISLVEGI